MNICGSSLIREELLVSYKFKRISFVRGYDTRFSLFIRPLLLPRKNCPYKRDGLSWGEQFTSVLFTLLCASEIWPDKSGGLWWKRSYTDYCISYKVVKREITNKPVRSSLCTGVPCDNINLCLVTSLKVGSGIHRVVALLNDFIPGTAKITTFLFL